MATVEYNQNPKISDIVSIKINTTDSNGAPINPYRVDSVVIYQLVRDFTRKDNVSSLEERIGDSTVTVFYTSANPVKIYGSDILNPAWLSTDTDHAFITQITVDSDGNPLTGIFNVQWQPELATEGDYYVVWKWTPIPAADQICNSLNFILFGDTSITTSTPLHKTDPEKYITLLDRYTPDMFKTTIASTDVTPIVIDKFNQAVAKGFTTVEDLANQVLDLIDSNATRESILPYLANLFKNKLRSSKPTLWRRQIKDAVPLFKKKGTLSALTQALEEAGIVLQKFTHLWQVVSRVTWVETFQVTIIPATWTLLKLALLPSNVTNFEVWLRPVGMSAYVILTTDYVSFSNATGFTVVTWVGDTLPINPISLHIGDFVKVVYQYGVVVDQSLENYIRTLPIADIRDETTIVLPPKNWNVRLIAEDDVLFSLVVATRHPFANVVVWGKVRTEFAYSENIYNMEEYNGSFRDSIDPCDIDRNFIDVCTDGQSSKFAVNVEVEELSDDRLRETEEIIRDNVPFHAQLHSINYSGGVNEYIIPPIENIQILVDIVLEENVLIGQSDFNRLITDSVTHAGEQRRNLLSTGTSVASGMNATGFNSEIVLFATDIPFGTMSIKPSGSNLLEILSGINAGEYTVSNPGQNVVTIDQGMPDTIIYPPLDTTEFPYRLSNEMFTTAAASIFQDDYFTFSESDVDYTVYNIQTELNNPVNPWNVVVPTGPYAGAYVIHDVLPDNVLVIRNWVTTINITGIKYKITTQSLTSVVLDRTIYGAGMVIVQRRGRVETTNIVDDWYVNEGDFIRYAGIDYNIIGFRDHSTAYILDYTGGNAAGVSVVIYRRLVSGIGFLDFRGMYLITTTDYESSLNIQDGSNPPLIKIENSAFLGNFLIQVGTDYYQVSRWNGTRIDLVGPKYNWGLPGTPNLSYAIIQYIETPNVVINGQVFQRVNRRGEEPVTVTSTSLMMSMSERVASLNAKRGSTFIDTIGQDESIDFEILWEDGTVTKGGL